MYFKQFMESVEDKIVVFDKSSKALSSNFQDTEFGLINDLRTLVPSVLKKRRSVNFLMFNRWRVKMFRFVFQGDIEAVCAVIKDTQKDDVEQRFKAVALENQKLLGVLHSSYDGIGIIDCDGTLLSVNDSYLRITGLTRDDSGEGRKVSELEQSGHVSKAVGIIVLEKKQSITIRQRIKTGKEVLITGNPVFNERGMVDYVVANIRDLRELQSLGESISISSNANKTTAEKKLDLPLPVYHWRQDNLVAKSQSMANILDTAMRIGPFDSTVLIKGESGVGKEVVAKVIHNSSNRKNKPFIAFNCSAISESLLESELFGYSGGSFTGANREGKKGIFQAAHGGTLVLDEIGEMPLSVQVKILRVIQEREILPVGSSTTIPIDVRFLALTNRDLKVMVKEGTFREDLYYRLNIVPIDITPLRERREDTLHLAICFAREINKKYGMKKHLHCDLLQMLQSFPWQGNVRELKALIERLLVTVHKNEILPKHLPPEYLAVNKNESANKNKDANPVNIERVVPLKDAREQAEKEMLQKAMVQGGSSRSVARLLGVDHSTVVRKVKKYQLSY